MAVFRQMFALFGALFPAPIPSTYTLCTYGTGNPRISGVQGSLCTYARTEVYIYSNPKGSGSHQVDGTCTAWGALGQQRIQRRPGVLGGVGLAKGV